MTLDELRAEARAHGYLLVHRDRVRTATTSTRYSKLAIGRVDRDRQVELIQNELSRRLAHFLVSEGMVRVAELPHEWDLEFRLDLQVLGPKTPDPDSEEHFIYRPFDGRDRP